MFPANGTTVEFTPWKLQGSHANLITVVRVLELGPQHSGRVNCLSIFFFPQSPNT